MVTSEQQTVDCRDAAAIQDPWAVPSPAAERAARETLRAQVARLECELSGVVAGKFPHVSPISGLAPAPRGPHLLTLAELEHLRDRLALRVREAQRQSSRRDASEREARDLLERMKAEPGSYKFVRLPVVDLGEHGCGAWQVRPRLGLIGMLAGWWQLKLSSGCPLARGPRTARPRRHHSNRGRAPRGPGVTIRTGAAHRAAPASPFEQRPRTARPRRHHSNWGRAPRGPAPSSSEQQRLLLAAPHGEHRGERAALALGHRADGLGL